MWQFKLQFYHGLCYVNHFHSIPESCFVEKCERNSYNAPVIVKTPELPSLAKDFMTNISDHDSPIEMLVAQFNATTEFSAEQFKFITEQNKSLVWHK